jgi:hypothetical protein
MQQHNRKDEASAQSACADAKDARYVNVKQDFKNVLPTLPVVELSVNDVTGTQLQTAQRNIYVRFDLFSSVKSKMLPLFIYYVYPLNFVSLEFKQCSRRCSEL